MPPQRYVPQIPFPRYAFVPGQHPHPVTDPRGHSFERRSSPHSRLDPHAPLKSPTYLFAIDLFNHGYYWEAHEAWEELWVAAGRQGEVADFLKGLIKLAAAGVKCREGQLAGVERHARRALELFHNLQCQHPEAGFRFGGFAVEQLIEEVQLLLKHPIVDTRQTEGGLPVLGLELKLCPTHAD